MMKQPRKILSGLIIAGFAVLYFASMMPETRSYPPFLNKAKQLGLPAKDCAYCHTSPQGGEQHNARGNWLVAQKKERKAYAVDVSWLKDYKATETTKAAPKKSGKKKT